MLGSHLLAGVLSLCYANFLSLAVISSIEHVSAATVIKASSNKQSFGHQKEIL